MALYMLNFKRMRVHAGRLAGPQTIEDMRRELWNSVEAVSSFGAEMEGLPEVLAGADHGLSCSI